MKLDPVVALMLMAPIDIYLNACSPVGRTILERLGDIAMLQEVWPCWKRHVVGGGL